jgi:8-oxo-dGTP pyrophosphatase MutT (NUDIX family)
MIEFEILARGLYQPNQLKIAYNPPLTMPTTGTVDVGTLRNAQFIAPSHPLTTNVEDPKMTSDKITRISVGADLSRPSPIYRPSGKSPIPPHQFDDIHHSAPTIQQWMDTLWQQKLTLAQQQNIPLYDTPLFRLIRAKAQPNGNLHLTLGNTTYKEYITTREPTFAQNRPREELSNPLAVCSVIETTDNYILLDKRQGVDVYAGRFHVIGGFFERDLDTTATIETTATSATIATSATNPDPFAAIRREIREETGIQSADIAEQHCLGIVYDLATPHAELCFLTRLNIPLREVHQRVPEENEIKQLLSLYITEDTLRDFILTNHGNISSTGEPNLLMYGAVKFGEEWFEEIIGRLLQT